MNAYNTLQYFLDDYPRTLFPLTTNRIVIQNSEKEIVDYLYQKVLDAASPEHSFSQQVRVHASKSGLHLRRTVKLDPVAEYFIYDIVYRNRSSFRKDFQSNRTTFGYRFEGGVPISPADSYGRFRSAVLDARKEYKYGLKFDISTYFNSIYHHDLVKWFSEGGRSTTDTNHLGQFLREINGGRSVDCLTHGLHPAKLLGSEFLKYVDNFFRVRCELYLRFLDDFYIFSDDEQVLAEDFNTIQRLLGERSLSVNPAKTVFGEVRDPGLTETIDDMKKSLLRIRREVILISGEREEEEERVEYEPLNNEQTDYLIALLQDQGIEESDAELVLTLLRHHGEDILDRMAMFLQRFPGLSRNICSFARHLSDTTGLAQIVRDFLRDSKSATEDQLFWLGKLAEDHLSKSGEYPDILSLLYEHPNATVISRAKILEIPEQRFGFPDLRQEHLRTGQSDWLAWASAVGTRGETRISRNHVLSYFGKSSGMNKLVAECVQNLP